MSRKICIAFGVHSLCAGGTERVVSVLLNELSEKPELDLHLVMYGRMPEQFYDLPASVLVHRAPFRFDRYHRQVAIVKTISYIRQVIKSIDPQVFVNFGEFWNNLVLLATRGLRTPVVVADRSSPRRLLGRIHEPLRRVLYKRSAGVIVQTRQAAVGMRDIVKGHVPVHIIPNPLFGAPMLNNGARRNEILFVGRLIPTKHVDRLVRAFEQSRFDDWRLTIVGEDAQSFSEKQKLQELVNARGLGSSVQLVGAQRDVEKYYRRASIFAFPSSSEGFPNALAEALSFGLPSVAYDCSAGPADLIEEGKNGFLVPVFDDEAFTERLRRLMQDAELRERMGLRAVASVARLEKGRIAEQFLKACDIKLPVTQASEIDPASSG